MLNERIKELALQAMVTNNRGDGYYNRVLDEQKFAELIVRECAGLLEDEARSSHDEDTPTYNVLMKESEWIKRYFGVEL